MRAAEINLTPRQLEVCELRYARSYTHREIAELLGTSRVAVTRIIARARRHYPHMPRLLTNGRHRRKTLPLDAA